MSVLMVQAWRCDCCTHIWLASTKPKRCAKCKKVTWDRSEAQTVERRSPKPKAASSILATPAKIAAKVFVARPKYGEKCAHGYMNWMVCPDCRTE